MNRLAGKTAIVTGGAIGIGRACVIRMAEEDAKVAIFDLLEAEGKALAADLTAKGHEAAFWPVDVADEAGMKTAIDAAAARFGGLHVLVNNAGISGSPKPTDQVTEAEWDLVQAVNVKGVFFGTKHAIPHLRAAGKGAIINLSSIAGLIGIGGIAPYHASKGAVRLMTKNDAITYAAEKIRVNSIHPGHVVTPLTAMVHADEAEKAKLMADTPLGRAADPEEIASAILFLAGDGSRYMTGAELVVDGGSTAQ